MPRNPRFAPVAALVALVLLAVGRADAQYQPGYPANYQISNGQYSPAYGAARGFYPQRPYYGGAQTVTNYQPLINAITSIPGWYGPAPSQTHYRPVRPRPTVAFSTLLKDDGTILWPSATPAGPDVAPSKLAAEAAVRAAVRESRTYGHASVRLVADARNKLTAFAAKALPALKEKNAADAQGLERFIVELKKTLGTLALNY